MVDENQSSERSPPVQNKVTEKKGCLSMFYAAFGPFSCFVATSAIVISIASNYGEKDAREKRFDSYLNLTTTTKNFPGGYSDKKMIEYEAKFKKYTELVREAKKKDMSQGVIDDTCVVLTELDSVVETPTILRLCVAEKTTPTPKSPPFMFIIYEDILRYNDYLKSRFRGGAGVLDHVEVNGIPEDPMKHQEAYEKLVDRLIPILEEGLKK